MKLSHALILALAHLITVGAVIWLGYLIKERELDNMMLYQSAAQYEQCRDLVVVKFGSPVERKKYAKKGH